MKEKNIYEFELFKNIKPQDLEKFNQLFNERIHLNQEDILFRKGELGDSMFLLLGGLLQVQLDTDDEQIDMAHQISFNIEPGAVIGEICVFGQKTRSATIQALKPTELLHIDGKQFRKLIDEHDIGALLISYNISKLLSKRLVNSNYYIRKLQKLTDNIVIKSEMEHFRDRFFDESLFN